MTEYESSNPNVSNWQVAADMAWELACAKRREAEAKRQREEER